MGPKKESQFNPNSVTLRITQKQSDGLALPCSTQHCPILPSRRNSLTYVNQRLEVAHVLRI